MIFFVYTYFFCSNSFRFFWVYFECFLGVHAAREAAREEEKLNLFYEDVKRLECNVKTEPTEKT